MYQINNPVKIISGAGSIQKLPDVLKRGLGVSVLFTTPGMTKRLVTKQILDICQDKDILVYDKIKSNPTIADLSQYLKDVLSSDFLNGRKIDNYIALGGGSVIDVVKSISIINRFDITASKLNKQHIQSYFEKGKPFQELDCDTKFYNIVAIPTTAGTGSEVTCWATAWDNENKTKYSLQHHLMYPNYAILDPELTYTLPHDTTVFSALDALSQAIEAIWNKNATPVSDALAHSAIKILATTFRTGFQHNAWQSETTRKNLQEASVLSGLAFSQTKTALAHSISYPLTFEYGVPHGLACSITLGEIFRMLLERDWKDPEECSIVFNRVEKIATAIRYMDSDGLCVTDDFYYLFNILKVKQYLKDYKLDKKKINKIKNKFINPTRAANFIIDVDNDKAVEIILQSLKQIRQYGR